MEQVPVFLQDIANNLSPGWTADDLDDAIALANLSQTQTQQLADFLKTGGDPDDSWVLLFDVLSGGNVSKDILSGYDCLNPSITINEWREYNLAPVFVATIIFAFLQQRKRLWPRLWNGRPGIAYPVNLVDAYDHRVAFSCAFCTCIVAIMGLFQGEWHINPDLSSIPIMVQGTVRFLVLILNVIEICFIYFPLFVCLTTSHVFLGQIVGFLYTSSWVFLYTYKMVECPLFASYSDTSTVSSLIVLPVYICLLYLLIRFFVGILLCCYKMYKAKSLSATILITPPREFRQTHYYNRVDYLFKPPPIPDKQTILTRLKSMSYQSERGFKYSRRFVITLAVSGLALYEVSLAYMFGVDHILSRLIVYFSPDGTLAIGFKVINKTEIIEEIHRELTVLKDIFWITSYVSLGIMVSFLIHMILVYRANTLRLWKGDRSFCPPEELAFATLMVANLRYSGYQIAYCIWGFLLLQVVLCVLVLLIVALLVHPYMDGSSNMFTEFIEGFWYNQSNIERIKSD